MISGVREVRALQCLKCLRLMLYATDIEFICKWENCQTMAFDVMNGEDKDELAREWGRSMGMTEEELHQPGSGHSKLS